MAHDARGALGVQRQARLSDGSTIDGDRYRALREAALATLLAERGDGDSRLREAAELLDMLVLDETFNDFLTVPGYQQLQ